MKVIIGFIFSAVILSGCGQNTPTTPTNTKVPTIQWQQHVQNMKALESWSASAQVAIKVDKKTQKAKMVWKQSNDQYSIAFIGPFGQAGPKLVGSKNSATLNIPNEKPLKGNNTSELLQQRLGWQLPVENAKYWILGIPSPLTDSKVLLKNERLVSLSQDGWSINYTQYKTVGKQTLPSKIIISRGSFNLLLVIYKWDITPKTAK